MHHSTGRTDRFPTPRGGKVRGGGGRGGDRGAVEGQESCYLRRVRGLTPALSEASRMLSEASQGEGKVGFRVGVGDRGVRAGGGGV